MKYSLMNIKTAPSRNGYSMSCTFLIDNVEVADFVDIGDGSEPSFYTYRYKSNRAQLLYEQWTDELDNTPEQYIAWMGHIIKVTKSLFIDILHACIVKHKHFPLELKSL